MEKEKLFLNIIEELNQHLEESTDYAMLRASALLRQLLMDGSPLIHQINRKYKLKLNFPVCGREYAEVALGMDPIFYSALNGIHRSGTKSHQLEEMQLDEFLDAKVLKLGSEILKIKDLIRISANILGGVHKGHAEEEKEKALEEFNQRTNFGGKSISAAQLRPIIKVTLEGLEPLIEKVRQ